METAAYLARIGFEVPRPAASREVLARLQAAHLLAVPFENLDILWPRPIRLDRRAFYRKIVRERRGGICCELNGLFEWLLADLGFATRLVSARVYRPPSVLRPEYDHMAILVEVGGELRLVDVGFGGLQPRAPLALTGAADDGPEGLHRVRPVGADLFVLEHRVGEAWHGVYRFSARPRRFGAFREMYRYHRLDAGAPFTQRLLCSRATPGGRRVLTDTSFVRIEAGERQRVSVDSEAAWRERLRDEFGIVASEDGGPPEVSAGSRHAGGNERGKGHRPGPSIETAAAGR